MVTQPKAIRLADALEATDQMHSNADLTSAEVATELRRLHEVNAELLTALKEAVAKGCLAGAMLIAASAAIAKATGGAV